MGRLPQTREVLEAMTKDSGGLQLRAVRVDGGMTRGSLLLQLQADILGVDVVRPGNVETTGWGAALAAATAPGVGVWSLEDISAKAGAAATTYHPAVSADGRQRRCHPRLPLTRCICCQKPPRAIVLAHLLLYSPRSTICSMVQSGVQGTRLDRDYVSVRCRSRFAMVGFRLFFHYPFRVFLPHPF